MRIKQTFYPCVRQAGAAAKDIKGLKNLAKDTKRAYKQGVAVSEYMNKNKMAKAGLVTKVTYKKGLKQHMPGIFACLLSPFPFGSVAGYGIGKIFQRFV